MAHPPKATAHHRSPKVPLVLGAGFALAVGMSLAATAPAFAATGASAATSAAAHPGHSADVPVRHLCSAPAHPGYAACMALVRTDIKGMSANAIHPDVPSGYGPSDLRSAYNLSGTGSSSETIAIVDAQDDPNAESDMAAYRSQYGLPACTTANGCFRKVNESGGTSYPSPDSGWSGEISLDLDMVSAIAPGAHILLVEATSADMSDLGAAVNEAVALGAHFVSNSYGGSEDSSIASADASYFDHPGVAITASAGDSAYGAEYPATSQYVTAVGGTSLTQGGGARGWSESVWETSASEGTGSGCSAYIAKPSWQTDTGCSNRMEADVSAVADPATGVAVYDSYQSNGWQVFGGTSAASPIIASVYALAGVPGSGDYPAQYIYSHTSDLNDVTQGSNGSCSVAYFCNAEPGYDGPTGWGTPNGTAAFTAGGGGGNPGNTVTVANPGSQSSTVGTAVSLQAKATDSAGAALTYSASGLPAGLSISSGTGLISGTPSTAGTFTTTVTATDSTGATGSASFSWTVVGTGGGGGGCTGLSAWSATTSYVPGDVVSYNGHKYTSTWYSTGAEPDAAGSWAVWQDNGAC